jgi:hypothetical protein
MDSIDRVLMDIENDMHSFSQMNIVLSRYWDDEKAQQFEMDYTSDIEFKWDNYSKKAKDSSNVLQSIEKRMKELSQELELDVRNI